MQPLMDWAIHTDWYIIAVPNVNCSEDTQNEAHQKIYPGLNRTRAEKATCNSDFRHADDLHFFGNGVAEVYAGHLREAASCEKAYSVKPRASSSVLILS